MLTPCSNAFPGQRAGNKWYYVKTKQYALACPSGDHVAIYSQVKTAKPKKRVTFFPTKYRHRVAAFTHI